MGRVDGGVAAHAVCVIEAQGGHVVEHLEVKPAAEGIPTMLARPARIASAVGLPIAIEQPLGLVVDTRIEAGHPVVPILPHVLEACRPRYRAAGGGSDTGDAYILADILRTDGHRIRPLHPCSDEIEVLRALTHTRDELVTERVAFANWLRSLLDGFWPGAAAIFADVASPIALAFVQR